MTDKNIKKMVETLEYIAADPKTRRVMQEEYWAALNETIWENQLTAVTNKNEVLTNKNEELTNKNEALTNKVTTQSNEIVELRQMLQQAGIEIPST
jgi:hypothetical protein